MHYAADSGWVRDKYLLFPATQYASTEVDQIATGRISEEPIHKPDGSLEAHAIITNITNEKNLLLKYLCGLWIF